METFGPDTIIEESGEDDEGSSKSSESEARPNRGPKRAKWKLRLKKKEKGKKKKEMLSPDISCLPRSRSRQSQTKDSIEALRKLVERTQYTSCYCEENVWWLCRKLAQYHEHKLEDADDWESYAMFISNPDRRCPVWFQRAALDDDAPCLWDYHVVLFALSRSAKRSVIVDLDSTLGLVTDAKTYIHKALAPALRLPTEYHAVLRIVRSDMYQAFFASDRRHMKNYAGQYASPPPRYNSIRGPFADADHNLNDYWPDIPDDDSVIDANDFLHSIHNAAGQPLGVALALSTFTEWLQALDSWFLDSAHTSAGASTDQILAGVSPLSASSSSITTKEVEGQYTHDTASHSTSSPPHLSTEPSHQIPTASEHTLPLDSSSFTKDTRSRMVHFFPSVNDPSTVDPGDGISSSPLTSPTSDHRAVPLPHSSSETSTDFGGVAEYKSS